MPDEVRRYWEARNSCEGSWRDMGFRVMTLTACVEVMVEVMRN